MSCWNNVGNAFCLNTNSLTALGIILITVLTLVWWCGCCRRGVSIPPRFVMKPGFNGFDKVVVIESTVSPEGNSGQHVYLQENTFLLNDNARQQEGSLTYTININQRFQTIKGFGGAFTDASIHCLDNLPKEKAKEVMHRYFGSKSKDSTGYSIG